MTNQQGAPEALDDLYLKLHGLSKRLEGSGLIHEDDAPEAYPAILEAMNLVRRLQCAQSAALVEAQQPAKAENLRQILTDPENQPNQYGVQFLMHGAKMAFRIGNRQFCLDYEPDEPGEFEFMRDALISAFSIFTPDVKLAQQPAPSAAAASGQEPAFWMNEKGHTWSHSDWKQFPNHRAKYPIPLYAHWPAPQPSPTPQADSAQDEFISREQWVERAMRVYLIAGDTEDEARECAEYQWGELDMDDIPDPYFTAMEDIEGRGPAPQADSAPADPDGEAFRTAARLGLTLRFYGGCAQSSMPGTPSAYEVVAGQDRATAMREAVERAAAAIARGGESQRLDSLAPQADSQPAPVLDSLTLMKVVMQADEALAGHCIRGTPNWAAAIGMTVQSAVLAARAPAESGLPFGVIDPDYARAFTKARVTAWQHGYAIALQGSFTRDLDLVAIPWTDEACDAERLIAAIEYRTGLKRQGPPSDKPHGRKAVSLLFPGFEDPRWVDLSILQRAPADSVTAPAGEAAGWRVRMICCGKDEGFQLFKTWDSADAFRNEYTSGYGVEPHGFSAPEHSGGHRRAAILEALYSVAQPTPPAQAADSVLEDAARKAIDKVLALFPFDARTQKFHVNGGPPLKADGDTLFYSAAKVLEFITEIHAILDAARKQGANHD